MIEFQFKLNYDCHNDNSFDSNETELEMNYLNLRKFRVFVPHLCPVLCLLNCFTNGYRGSFPWGKARPGRDADHSPPSSAKVKNE
jgi:hypothetical protein